MVSSYKSTSLQEYATLKLKPKLENYLIDKTDFEGVALKFKVRSNTLPLNNRTSKWNSDNNKKCRLCNLNSDEDIHHFILSCPALNNIRNDEMYNLNKELFLTGNYELFYEFHNANENTKFKFILGCYTLSINSECEHIFDKFCKKYIKRAWKLRNEILNSMP